MAQFRRRPGNFSRCGSGKIGVTGFCYGGGVSNNLAVRLGTDLSAAAPFYGGAPAAKDDVAKIKAAILVHHGELDTRLVQAWPAYDASLKEANVTHEGYVYPGAVHGFHCDATPERYNKTAADLAWGRTVDCSTSTCGHNRRARHRDQCTTPSLWRRALPGSGSLTILNGLRHNPLHPRAVPSSEHSGQMLKLTVSLLLLIGGAPVWCQPAGGFGRGGIMRSHAFQALDADRDGVISAAEL